MGTRIIGIDCAVQEPNIGIAIGEVTTGGLQIGKPEMSSNRSSVDVILAFIDVGNTTLLCLDAPLGWPEKLGDSLINHNAGDVIDHSADQLFSRETDQYVWEHYRKKPLEVGADRIARTALSALKLLNSLRERLNIRIELAWNSHIGTGVWAIEVYPAATAIAHGANTKGCKDKIMGEQSRKKVLAQLAKKLNLNIGIDDFSSSHHAFDALIFVIAGHDFLSGMAAPPKNIELAKKESWIWVKQKT